MSSLQYVWQTFADEECGGETVSSTPITLHKEKTGPKGRFQGITFNGKFRPWGRWFYLYDEFSDKGYMFIEFAAGSGYPRRHAFSQLDDDVFELLAADSWDDVYYNEALWSPKSKPHTNTGMVLLQKDRSSKYLEKRG